MSEVLKYRMSWLMKILLSLISIFIFQFCIVAASVNPFIFESDEHTVILETYTYDEIESSIGVEVDRTGGLSRVLSKNKVGADGEVLGAVASVAAKGSTSLVRTGTQWSKHSLQRLAERGITPKMAETAIAKGQKFYDPLNKSINYVLPNGFASGKSLLVGTNPLTGQVTTVLRSSKNLINKRFIPIP